MNGFDFFTVAAGLASVLGLAIQLFDFFPSHRTARERTLVFAVGVFAGSVVRAIQPGSIKLDFHLTGYAVFVGLGGAAVFILVVIASLKRDPEERGQLYWAAGIGLIPYVMALFFGFIAISADSQQQLTIHELNMLADQAAQERDFDRAETYLQTIESRFDENDPRRATIEARIKTLEAQAIQK